MAFPSALNFALRLALAFRQRSARQPRALRDGNTFRALHQGPRAFIIANAWDAGSARVLAGLGFGAIATSSGASAGVYGKRDGAITREQALAHARAIAAFVELSDGHGDLLGPALYAFSLSLLMTTIDAPDRYGESPVSHP